MCMQAYVFPRTSRARNPIVIIRIFIFIFLWLKVVLQAKPCKGGRCNLEGWSRLLQISLTQKNTFILRVFAYNSHTVCCRFKNLYPQIPWMELNHFASGPGNFLLESFFIKSQNPENLLFQTPPWNFVSSAWNLAGTLFSWTWSKVIKRFLLGQKIHTFYEIWSVWCRANPEAIPWRWSLLVKVGVA